MKRIRDWMNRNRREKQMPLDGPMTSSRPSDGVTRRKQSVRPPMAHEDQTRHGFSEDVLLANLAMDFGPPAVMSFESGAKSDLPDADLPRSHAEFDRYIAALEARLSDQTGRAPVQTSSAEPSASSAAPDVQSSHSEPPAQSARAPVVPADGPCAFSASDLSLDIPDDLDSVQLGAFLDVLTQTMLALPATIDQFCRGPDLKEPHQRSAAALEQLAQAAQHAGIRGIATFASHSRKLVDALADSGLAASHAAFATLRRAVTVLKQMSDAVWSGSVLDIDMAEVLDELIEAEFRALVHVTAREQVHTVSLRVIAESVQQERSRTRFASGDALLDRALPA